MTVLKAEAVLKPADQSAGRLAFSALRLAIDRQTEVERWRRPD